MSGIFGSVTIPGNRLTDIAKQTSTVGIPIPFGYGRYTAPGNIIWTDEVKEHVKKKKQGKGGVKTQEYSYTRSYAIGFAVGPIKGYLTIKRAGKVVFTTDPNATVEDKDYAAKWLQKATLYYGSRTQLPDSTIEAVEGSGQVSAFRKLAYIVLENDDVTDQGGAVPPYEAVIIANSVVYLTTPPYPVEVVEELGISGVSLVSGEMNDLLESGGEVERLGVSAAMVAANMRTLRKDGYTPPEKIQIAAALTAGELRTIRKDGYTPSEKLQVSATMTSGTMETARLDAVLREEKLSISATMVGGFLGAP